MIPWRRIWIATLAATLAWMVAKALNVPIWNEGWSLDAVGDRTDFAFITWLLAFNILSPRPLP